MDDENDFTINKIETEKDKLYRTPAMKQGIIPNHPESTLFCGQTGSGKTNCLLSLLKKKSCYKDYFNHIYLFSASPDQLFDDFPDEKLTRYDDQSQYESELQDILDTQERFIDQKGIQKTPRVLCIFEDIISNTKFMKSKPFLKSFIGGRHYNMSVFICSQYFNKVPRTVRLNCMNVIYFPSSNVEKKLINDEYCPHRLSCKEFDRLIDYATHEPYSFLCIKKKQPLDKRFMKKFDEFLTIY